MDVGDFIGDPRFSIDPSIIQGGRARSVFDAIADDFKKFNFWSGRQQRLWEHQKAAISLCAAYIASQAVRPADTCEAALVKMPPGTGKTGVIALVARCMARVRRVLIITPREALVDQMIDDIDQRFWGRLDYVRAETKRGSRLHSSIQARAETVESAWVSQLLPSAAEDVTSKLNEDGRSIVISTFTALAQIMRDSLDQDAEQHSAAESLMQTLRQRLDLVIVDEGHYEPAHRWGRAVRSLSKPTILFSATPYRNDYKSFRVRGNFVFNYPLADALEQRIVRSVAFESPSRSKKTSEIDRFVDIVDEFFDSKMVRAAVGTTAPKLLVRGDDVDELKTLQNAIERSLGRPCVLIHHHLANEPERRRYHSVRAALHDAKATRSRIWLHDSKLLEGFDYAAFAGLAIFRMFGNSRELVQQIGRILRSSDVDRQNEEHAFVTASEGIFERVRDAWNRYLEFEVYCAEDARRIVQNEANMPDQILAQLPSAQYVQGDFRTRFPVAAPPDAKDFVIRKTAAVFCDPMPESDLEVIATKIADGLAEADRFEVRRVANAPANLMAFSYFAWRTSPLLRQSFFPEWTLGLFVLVKARSYYFIYDSEGIVLDSDDFGLERIEMQRLRRAFPTLAEARITQMSFLALDMSERAIRSQSTRTRSFGETFTDLLDPSFVPTSATGFIDGQRRYVGLTRSRISDSANRGVTLEQYALWALQMADLLNAEGERGNRVFDRYAPVVPKPDAVGGQPKSILFDLSDALKEMAELGDAAAEEGQAAVDYDDLCAELTDGVGEIRIGSEPFVVSVQYRASNGKYRIASEELDRVYKARTDDDRSLTSRLNTEQNFRVLTESGAVYANGYFYEPQLRFHDAAGTSPLLANVNAVWALRNARSEKGEKFYADKPEWYKASVFGLINGIASGRADVGDVGKLGLDLDEFEMIVCDDGSTEIADFVLLSKTQRKLAFVHAKASKDPAPMAIGALQEVGRQAQASLAFSSPVSVVPGPLLQSWRGDLVVDNVNMGPRIIRQPVGMQAEELVSAVADAIKDRSWNREVWIVLGRIMSFTYTNQQLNREEPSQRAHQFGFYLESLRTACGRANSQLKIYCPDEL